jgi:hypothetical protein
VGGDLCHSLTLAATAAEPISGCTFFKTVSKKTRLHVVLSGAKNPSGPSQPLKTTNLLLDSSLRSE